VNLSLVGPVYPHRGGIAHYTTRLYHALVERGHRVSLYSFSRQYPRWLFPGRTDRDPSTLKLQVECVHSLDTLNPVSWWATARTIRRQQPDELILQWWVPFFAPVWMLLALVARRAGIRVVFICHNVLPHEQRLWDVRLAQLTLRNGHGFVVQSRDERDQLLALLPGRPVEVVPHPIYDMFAEGRLSPPEARSQLGLKDDAPVLLFFGFVRAYKGLQHLLEALPIIRRELPCIRLLVVGEFWQDKRFYLDQIRRLEIEPNVLIVDRYVPNEELSAYFGAADVVVLPYTRVTQSGVVQLAYGFGRPVITTRVGGLPELVADGETGLLAEPGDSESLARAVCRFFNDGLGDAMHKPVTLAARKFAWTTMVSSLETLAQMD
jgi:glycosyltransferase involved in cell wall biosynthesis